MELRFADAHEHVDVTLCQRARHGGRTHVLNLRTGHELEHNRSVSFNGRLGRVVQLVRASDPDNGHPDMIAPATRLGLPQTSGPLPQRSVSTCARTTMRS